MKRLFLFALLTPLVAAAGLLAAFQSSIVCGQLPAFTGVITTSAGSCVTSYAQAPYVTVAATGVNFNSVADTALAFTVPPGYTRVFLFNVLITNASHTLTTAQFGVRTATADGGAAFIADGTAITVSATTDQTNNNAQSTNGSNTISAVAASLATPNTIYFRVTNPEGVGAIGDVTAVMRLAP